MFMILLSFSCFCGPTQQQNNAFLCIPQNQLKLPYKNVTRKSSAQTAFVLYSLDFETLSTNNQRLLPHQPRITNPYQPINQPKAAIDLDVLLLDTQTATLKIAQSRPVGVKPARQIHRATLWCFGRKKKQLG